jgi:hypothetical protein
MDGVFDNTYFYVKHRAYSSLCDNKFHDPGDADAVIIHYPHMETKADAALE